METILLAGLSNAVTATFLALLVACLGRLLARRPAILHCLWLLVLVKLVTPPLYEVRIPWPRPFAAIQQPAPSLHVVTVKRTAGIVDDGPSVSADIEVTELPAEPIIPEANRVADRFDVASPSRPAFDAIVEWLTARWMTLVATIWLAGTAAVVVLSAKRVWQFHRLLREARPACEETQEWVDELAMHLGLDRSPGVWWIGGKLSPLVWALGLRPRLIIPTELWKSLDDDERETLVVHELAHLRRGDHRVRIFELIVTALFWWHPVLWWVRQALHDVEEQCCDAWVVWSLPESGRSYAETLLKTLDFLNQSDQPVPLMGSGFGKVHHLRKRLTMIMSGTTPRLLGVRGALAALGMGVLLLPLNATWAQKPDQKEEVSGIVSSGVDPPKSADVVDTIVGDVSENNGEGVIDADLAGDGKHHVYRVDKSGSFTDVKPDDSTIVVTADSSEEAIEKLKQQVKILAKKSSGAEGEIALKAIQRVIAELERQAQKPKKVDSADGADEKQKRDLQIKVFSRDIERIISRAPEMKAEIDKARAKVKELTSSLQAKQKELVEVQRKLSKLEAERGKATVMVHSVPQVNARVAAGPDVTLAAPRQTVVIRKEVRSKDKTDRNPFEPEDNSGRSPNGKEQTGGPDQPPRVDVNDRSPHDFTYNRHKSSTEAQRSEAKRLDVLENKLQQLLDEVASLKKDRAK